MDLLPQTSHIPTLLFLHPDLMGKVAIFLPIGPYFGWYGGQGIMENLQGSIHPVTV